MAEYLASEVKVKGGAEYLADEVKVKRVEQST